MMLGSHLLETRVRIFGQLSKFNAGVVWLFGMVETPGWEKLEVHAPSPFIGAPLDGSGLSITVVAVGEGRLRVVKEWPPLL
jgi:hypothetical protein